MVQSSIGVFWRTDGHLREFQVVDGVGGNRGGDGLFLPFIVRLSNQDSSTEETKAYDTKPEYLC